MRRSWHSPLKLSLSHRGRLDEHRHAFPDMLGPRHAVLLVLQLRNDVGRSESVIRSATWKQTNKQMTSQANEQKKNKRTETRILWARCDWQWTAIPCPGGLSWCYLFSSALVRPETNVLRDSIAYRGALLWNTLPKHITTAEGIRTFKHILKKHDFKSFTFDKLVTLLTNKDETYKYF